MSHKLLALKINGTPLTELDSYDDSTFGTNLPFTIIDATDPIPAEYADVSGIENWWTFGYELRDYKYIRYEIMIIAAVTGWANLSLEEKTIAAKCFAVGLTERLEIFSVDQQINKGITHHRKSVQARSSREEAALSLLYAHLSPVDANMVVDDTDNLMSVYINRGREGTTSGDPEWLFDYIEATPGTSYETTGFARKSITPMGMSLNDLVTAVMRILRDGEYIPK